MAENEDGMEKSEEPTDKKKEKAREEGKILSSKEMFVFATLGMGTLMIFALAGTLGTVGGIWANYLNIPAGADMDSLLLVRLGDAWRHFLLSGLIVAIPIGATVLLLQFAMGGINFAPQALGFKASKINPLSGLKRMVSKQAIVELVKSVLKVSMLAAVAIVTLKGMLPHIGNMWASDAESAITIILRDIGILLAGLSVVLALIGAIDLVWQMRSMRESLMMTLKEVKDEAKEANGNPQIKGKIRQKQYEASRRGSRERAALKDVPNATAIVTNPTHFAVALRYVPGEMHAPVVIASGTDHIAKEIRRIGATAGVQSVEIPPLARALYFTTQIGQEIDERLFGAVATLLGYIYHVEHGYRGETPDIDLPEDLQLNEHGRPLKEKKQ